MHRLQLTLNNNNYNSVVSDNIISHVNGFDGWVDNRYHQLEKKVSFRGCIADWDVLGKVRVTKEIINTPFIEQLGAIPRDKVLFVCLNSTSDVFLNGRFINSGTFYLSSGKPLHAVAKSPIECFMVAIDKDFFFENVIQDIKPFSASMPFEVFVSPGADSVFDFDHIIRQWFADQVISKDYEATDCLYRLLGSLTEIALDAVGRPISVLPASTRGYIVDKSCELFFNNFENEEFGVLDLCAKLRVSRRTLQYSFESIVGMSPSNYIRNVRLNVARKILVCSPGEKVQAAAFDAGFNHLGRFSKYYQEFYGELPSETLLKFSLSGQRILQ